MNEMHPDETMDPRLKEYLKLLQYVPARDPRGAQQTLIRFQQELESAFPGDAQAGGWSGETGMAAVSNYLRRLVMFVTVRRTVFTIIMGIALIAVFLFGGVKMTASAARSALPGDALYSWKTGFEQAQISLARNLSQETELYMKFAANRLDEIEKLIAAGRYEDAIALSGEFHIFIQKALETAGKLSEVDPVRASELNIEINARLAEYSAQLSSLFVGLPEPVISQFQNKLPFTGFAASTSENENSNSNENENANLNENVNGNENESEDDDNSNSSDEANENGDDDEWDDDNSNANENGGDDGEVDDDFDDDLNGNENGQEDSNDNGDDLDDDDESDDLDDDLDDDDEEDDDVEESSSFSSAGFTYQEPQSLKISW